MMRKILLATMLLILLFAISYIKSVRGDSSRQAYLLEEQNESSRILQIKENQIDSLQLVAGSNEVAFADSLTKQRQDYQKEIDSLNAAIASGADEIGKLKQQQKMAAKKKKPAAKSVSKQTIDKNKRIMDYYKKRYLNLPEDLSAYERRIALNEIREETANKFKISLSKLKLLRSQSKLGY